MSVRTTDIAAELKQVMRLAPRDPEALEGELPALSSLHRVAAAGDLGDAGRVHFILRRLVPEYLERLPASRDCRAIRELLTWEDEDGETRSLTTRYHKASAHLLNAAHDFGRRQEPRLLMECARRFVALDQEDRLRAADDGAAPAPSHAGTAAQEAPAATAAQEAPAELAPAAPPPPPIPTADPSAGIAGVYPNLDYHRFADYMATAETIVILNTWIPELNILADALVEALGRGAQIRILMLYPDSRIARLRSEALQSTKPAAFGEDRVRPGVKHCLDVLGAIARMADDGLYGNLRVRLYHSLPSIAVYGADDRAFMSVFMHGQLAVRAPQIEVQGRDSLFGRSVFGEVETLWSIGQEFADVTRWEAELAEMGPRFGIMP